MQNPSSSSSLWKYVALGSTFVALSAVVVALGATAQGPPPGGRGGLGGGAWLAMLDADGDQRLSATEIDSSSRVLRARDRNGDGELAADELPAVGRGGRGGRGGEGRGPGGAEPNAADELVTTLMAFDGNTDGKLTKDEVPERMQDGQLTPEEIRQSAGAQPSPTNDGPGEGRRGGRGGGPGRDPLTTALDPNGDGRLDAAEIDAAPKALRVLDRNADGVIAMDELFGGRRGFGGGR
jgi:Ca2+-binding EF-hand superfamily protein